jgi:hypothetical protein
MRACGASFADQAPALTVQPLRLFLFRGWDPHSLVNKIEPNDHFAPAADIGVGTRSGR